MLFWFCSGQNYDHYKCKACQKLLVISICYVCSGQKLGKSQVINIELDINSQDLKPYNKSAINTENMVNKR